MQDASNNYSWGLVSAGGTVVCSTTNHVLSGTGWTNGTADTATGACSQGTVFWPGGKLYLIASGTAGTAQVGASYGSGPGIPFSSNGALSTSATAGQIPSSSVTMPSAGNAQAAGLPALILQ